MHFSASKLLLKARKSNKLIVDKAKPRVIVGRLPAIAGGGPTVPDGAGGKATGPRRNQKWFLTFSQKLKVIFGGFAIANPLDSRVAEAGDIIMRGPWSELTMGFFTFMKWKSLSLQEQPRQSQKMNERRLRWIKSQEII